MFRSLGQKPGFLPAADLTARSQLAQITPVATTYEVQTTAFSIQPTVDVTNNKFLLTGLNAGGGITLVENTCVDFMVAGTLPTGFLNYLSDHYFVHVVDANSFQLMTTRSTAGSAITLTDTGSGWSMRLAGVESISGLSLDLDNLDILINIKYIWGANTPANGDLGIMLEFTSAVQNYNSQGYVNGILSELGRSGTTLKYASGVHHIKIMRNGLSVKLDRSELFFEATNNARTTGVAVKSKQTSAEAAIILPTDAVKLRGFQRGVTGRNALWIGNGSTFKFVDRGTV